ncbi:MAG: hypothetical protein AAGA03_09445 [Planctomycetota bacterium]
MSEINLCNADGRDAIVQTKTVRSSSRVRWLDASGRQASSVRYAKATLEHDFDALLREHENPDAVGQALLDGDPEIDLENTGRLLSDTSRIYIGSDGQIVRRAQFFEIIRNPDGTVRERRARKLAEPNLCETEPLRWSGQFIPRAQAVQRFVFSAKQQLIHTNGLSFDFLFAMAEELEQKDSLMLLGAGKKSNQPLILRRGGTPYRGFLEGRTDGGRYCLMLHFSNLELKLPSPAKEPSAKNEPQGD